MQGFENHLRSAASQFSNGDFKDAYLSYLLAAQSLLNKLSTEIIFEDNNRVSSQPEYVQSLFSISTKCLRSAEDIVCNRCVYSPSTHLLVEEEERERDSEAMDTPLSASPNIVTVETTLPLVPLSPLTQMSIIHSSSLASASQKLTLAKRSKTPVGLPTLRRLTEDVRIQRGKLDSVNKQIKSVADAVICNWNPDAMAKQLTIIEAQLFSKLSIRQDFLSPKPRATKIQSCLDFHRYITNSIIHQIIAGSEVSNSAPREYPRDYIIAHVIRVAYLLLHVYRNFSGFAAVIKALTCPEVRRLRKSWKKVPGKTKEMLKDLSRHIKEENRFRSYHDALSYKLGEIKEFGPGLVAIPWMERHLEKIEAVLKSYSTGRKSDTNKFDPSLYLSEPGARKLEVILSTLEQCQGNPSEDKYTPERSKTPRRRTFMEIDGAKSQIALPSNLLDIGGTDLGLHHWLVSRVYLTRYQLWEESLEYESPAFGELVPTFVKENGQTLVESHHMGHHTEAAHFEDVGQFNDYFPSEENHPPVDLDRMESVDEFLSFLDQDLVESSTPNTFVLPEPKGYQHNNPWDEEIHTPSPALVQTPDSHSLSIENAFEETFPASQNSKADLAISDRFKLDTPSPRNSILFNSVKPSSNFSNVFQDGHDDSNNSSSLSPNGLGIFSSTIEDDVRIKTVSEQDPFIHTSPVESNPLTGGNSQSSQSIPDHTNAKSDSTSNHGSKVGEEVATSKSNDEDANISQLDTDIVQRLFSTSSTITNNLDSELSTSITNCLDETSILNSTSDKNSDDGSTTIPYVNGPITSNGIDKSQDHYDSSENNVELHDKSDKNPVKDTAIVNNSTSPKPISDVDQQPYVAKLNGELDGPKPETEVPDSNGHKLQFIDDNSHSPAAEPTLSEEPSENHPSNKLPEDSLLDEPNSLASSLPETPSNQKEVSVMVADFHDDGNSSEEEPRKYLSLEELIRLNESSYAGEKSDGDTSITITDEEIEATVDSDQITPISEYKKEHHDLNGTSQDYTTGDDISMGNSAMNPDTHE